MKRFFLLASAAIAMLCAASCQEEMNGPDVQNGNEVTATVTVKAPGALATKAIADGTKAKNLVLGVFDADNNDKYLYSVGTLGTFNAGEAAVEFNENLTATVELTLMKGKSYKFVCWASDPTLECYTIAENFAAINVSYTVDNESNNENRDAFYACAPSGVVTADYSTTITLKRPLAQINVGTTSEDLAAAVKAGLDASQLTVTMSIPNPATVLDPITGEATSDGNTENYATFTSALSPVAVNPEEKIVVNTQTTKGTYEWLAMNYILVDKDALTNLKFTVSEGDREIDTYSVPFAPVQKNWRTNILGDLLTDKGSITVIIDPKFDDIYDVAYGSSVTFAELNAAIKDAKVGTYNVGGKVTEVAEGSAAGYEVVTLTDEEGGSGSYELKVPETKAAYTGFYKVNDYVVVAVSVDSEGNATHDENHVLHIPADVEEEPEVPVEPVLTIAEPEVEVSAEAGEVTFAVESNVEWTVSEVEGLTVTPAEAAFTVAYPANETAEPVTYTLTVSAEGVQAVTVTIKQAAAEVEEPEVVVATIAEFLAAEVSTDVTYQLTGIISSITEINANYGNATLTIKDDEGNEVTIYRMKAADGGVAIDQIGLTLGDELTVAGNRAEYNSKPQMSNGYYVSHIDNEAPEVTIETLTIPEFLAAAESTTRYKVSGKITGISISTQYGNADIYIEDEEGNSLYIFRMKPADGGAAIDQIGLNINDILTVVGERGSYNGSPQMINGNYESHIDQDPPTEPGEDEILYSTGFESSESFVASTVYNNKDPKLFGEEGKQWGVVYGTASTTSPLVDAQSMQMRYYTADAVIPYCQMEFDVENASKVIFQSMNTANNNVLVQHSTDSGASWSTGETFTIKTSPTTCTYEVGEKAAKVRFKFTLVPPATPTNKSRLYLDDVKIL